jgi:hypothetical protein
MKWFRRLVFRLSTVEMLKSYRTELLMKKGDLLILCRHASARRLLRDVDSELDDVNAELARRGLV